MTDTIPLTQPPIEDLRNCLMVAELGVDLLHHIDHEQDAASAFGDIARLIRHALEGISEPNEAAIRFTTRILLAGMGERAFTLVPDGHRVARDIAAAILHAQVTGLSPDTL